MKGDAKVIEFLNAALRLELTAVSQYWLHFHLQEDWGHGHLAIWPPKAGRKASKRCNTQTN